MEENLVEIKGSVEDLIFRKDDSGFTVIDFSTEDEYITVVGILPELSIGEELRLKGTWVTHPTFGRQFRAQLCERSLPSTAADLYKYLSSGTVKGIGAKTAQKIIDRFGEDTFDVLEKQPERLAEIKGISLQKAMKMSASFNEQFAVRQIMISLERFGMTPNECLKAFKAYGVNAVDLIVGNPYILCTQGIGVSFDRAEDIADKLPEKPDMKYRLQAGIIHTLKHNLNNGHTCLPKNKILKPCSDFLSADIDLIIQNIDELVFQKKIIEKEINSVDFLFLPDLYRAEVCSADRMRVMLKFPPAGKPTLLQDIENIEHEESIIYDENQKKAIITAVEKGMLILTGGPGTGKTTTLNGILKLFEADGLRVMLAAPTGRAAKRMSEITGKEAKTIHRLLEVEWDKDDNPYFAHDMKNPLKADALIVDELSMVDVSLFASLIDAIPFGCRFIMVGDSDQLPAVGAGNVLHDLIKSGQIPVVELEKVFRQAMKSKIITNAHDIVSGTMPDLNCRDNDFFFMQRKSNGSVVQTVVDLCSKRLPKAYGFSSFTDIQVLCPSRKGETGSIYINKALQSVLNPKSEKKKEVSVAGRLFREGDKVMQIKNNYDIVWSKSNEEGSGIFNGD
ncbi:MAG: Flp pilus assembly complex ATPase component TadA, partial [Ruminococcus sp.]|nr:Flp pilus assembly complex ATPase component TadA [Candidatus Copronaster equi]